jgi:hypothetical protein
MLHLKERTQDEEVSEQDTGETVLAQERGMHT